MTLKIAVLIKQVPVPKAMRTTAEGLMDRSVDSMMNPFCKHALEAALRVKDKHDAEITVFSMGPPNFQQSLREALSMGADHAYLLSDRRLAGSDTWATAFALSHLIRKVGTFDLYFAGLQTIDGDTAHVGPQVAERLGIPHIAYVEDVHLEETPQGRVARVRRLMEGGWLEYETPLPSLLTITNTGNIPRGPSLKYAIRARNADINILNIDDVGIPEEKVGLAGSPTIVWRVKNVVIDRPPCVFFDEGSVEDKVAGLLERLQADMEVKANE